MISKSDIEHSQHENLDYVFHYTRYDNALNIITTNTIWAYQLSDMNDPVEFRPLENTLSFAGDVDFEQLKKRHNELTVSNNRRNNKIRVLSFSVDDTHIEDEIFKKCVSFDNNLNHGWARTGMWAHYGDKHKGICLIFNRNKLIEAAKTNHDIKFEHQKIEYSNNFHDFEEACSVDLNDINIDKDFTSFYMTKDKQKYLFQKCMDFISEQEYRFLFISDTFTDKEPYKFNFEDALEGVIFSDRFDGNNLDELKDISKKFKVPLFRLQWEYGTPEIYDFYNNDTDNLTQKMKIVNEIYKYLHTKRIEGKKYAELKCSDIRKWPAVDKICSNHNSRNICHAMNEIHDFETIEVSGNYESTTYTVKYKLDQE
ncbi:DUF2971 domain-containing protein [Treponema sp.]|uniref:DUF2971 domain-containing protein n=1 Tax=Treponema sp. TaxID=166 RepID=UPI002A7FF47E|nr:DUF2971 domain-containing protein [Treponema sp.]MDY4132854.1 DUF2971 domain-containing protein [Treponema sp.]